MSNAVKGLMMKKFLFILLFIFLAGQFVFAQVDEISLFVKGNEAYENQEYGEAIEFYEQILRMGKTSGALYYNLGNAHFRQGSLGKALLYYERAKKLIPRDQDLQANARFASALIQGQESSRKTILGDFFSLRKWLTLSEYYWILFLMIMMFVVTHLMSLYFSWKRSKKISALALLALIIVFWSFNTWMKIFYHKDQAVILAATSARFEPREGATVHFDVSEGWLVTVEKIEGEWVRVKRSDGRNGWIQADKLEKI